MENGGGVQGVAMVVMVLARVVCSGWLMFVKGGDCVGEVVMVVSWC